MMTDETADRQLDDLLQRSYSELRKPDRLQREAVLNGLFLARAGATGGSFGPPVLSGPDSRLRTLAGQSPRQWRVASISAILALSVVAAVLLLRWTPSDGSAYGIDGLPERLQQMQTIAVRGWSWTRDATGPNKPPIRAPFEMLVKRPGMFRHSITGLSVKNGRTELRQSLRLCDGKEEWMADETGKPLFFRRSISPLEARLKTETLAQIEEVTAVLGPVGTRYRKTGTDSANGRRCDLYEAQFHIGSHTTSAKVWLDPKTGLPSRVLRHEMDATGKVTDEIDLTDITVNAPLSDDLFRRPGSDTEKPSKPDELHNGTEPPPLDASPFGSVSSGETKLEVWYSLRISDNAALLIWRRSRPHTSGDASPDWLSDMTFTIADPSGKRPARHAWLDQAESPDKWSWSLIVPADGKPLGPNGINLTLVRTSLVFLALRFNDEELKQILTAAQNATLGRAAELMSLADLRAKARELTAPVKTQ
jgi:outer membrane lipoprotein-sorting protein